MLMRILSFTSDIIFLLRKKDKLSHKTIKGIDHSLIPRERKRRSFRSRVAKGRYQSRSEIGIGYLPEISRRLAGLGDDPGVVKMRKGKNNGGQNGKALDTF